MRKLSIACVVLLMSMTCVAGEAIDKTARVAWLLTLDDGTEIHVLTFDKLEISAQQALSEPSKGRTELRGDVRVSVVRNGIKRLEIKTHRAVLTRFQAGSISSDSRIH